MLRIIFARSASGKLAARSYPRGGVSHQIWGAVNKDMFVRNIQSCSVLSHNKPFFKGGFLPLPSVLNKKWLSTEASAKAERKTTADEESQSNVSNAK